MGKVKTKEMPIDWLDDGNGNIVGNIANTGLTMSQITDELEVIPVDVPSLTCKDCTKTVTINFPENFAAERKDDVLETLQELYPDWKISKSGDNFQAIAASLNLEPVQNF